MSSSPHPPTRSLRLALIPLGIGLNMSLGTIVSMLKLPVYLDMIGTIVVTILSGLWAGVLTATLTQLIVSATVNPIYYNFIPTAVAVALFTHIAARKGAFRTMRRTVLAGMRWDRRHRPQCDDGVSAIHRRAGAQGGVVDWCSGGAGG